MGIAGKQKPHKYNIGDRVFLVDHTLSVSECVIEDVVWGDYDYDKPPAYFFSRINPTDNGLRSGFQHEEHLKSTPIEAIDFAMSIFQENLQKHKVEMGEDFTHNAIQSMIKLAKLKQSYLNGEVK